MPFSPCVFCGNRSHRATVSVVISMALIGRATKTTANTNKEPRRERKESRNLHLTCRIKKDNACHIENPPKNGGGKKKKTKHAAASFTKHGFGEMIAQQTAEHDIFCISQY